jgi:hypothetical protein
VVELIILKAMRSKTMRSKTKRTMNLEVMLSVLCAAAPAAFAFGTRNTAADACCLAIGLSARKTGST